MTYPNCSSFGGNSNISSPLPIFVHVPANATETNELAPVSSFYGPGASACWYLTCLSCLVSWILHPKKRFLDNINIDLMVMATFPTMAAGHMIIQVQNWPTDSSIAHARASLVASLTISETYIPLCIFLMLPGCRARVPRRLSFLAITGIFCLVSETYLYFALPSIRQKPGAFERSYIINSFPLLGLILALVSILLALLLLYICLLFLRNGPKSAVEQPAKGVPDSMLAYVQSLHPPPINKLNILGISFMFIALMSATAAPISDLVFLLKSSLEEEEIGTGKRRFVNEFFPRTAASIDDLDQAAALLAGMTTLGFSLFSAAKAHYNKWWAKEKRQTQNAVF